MQVFLFVLAACISPLTLFTAAFLNTSSLRQQRQQGNALFEQPNIEARSLNHCCTGKASVTYTECVFAALGTLPATRVRSIVVCGLSGSINIFFPHIH